MPGMTKRLGRTNRVEFRLPPDLDAAVRAECARRGWNITEWGERACRALLSELGVRPAAPSQANGAGEAATKGKTGDPARADAGVSSDPGAPPTRPTSSPRARRADIGPKPLSATKPRPKAATRKMKP